MSISTGRGPLDDYAAIQVPGRAGTGARGPAMFRRHSMLPSRRAVLQLLPIPDATQPAALPETAGLDDLAAWFTERAFNFYLAGVRMPRHRTLTVRRAARPSLRQLAAVFADLDVACSYLSDDGMENIIVLAQGTCAIAAAQWSDVRRADAHRSDGRWTADALILSAPALPAMGGRSLDISCPVLVLSSAASGPAGGRARGRTRWQHRADVGAVQLGRHVTWLRLPDSGGVASADDLDRGVFFTELGRWLGAYMYGQARDQLL